MSAGRDAPQSSHRRAGEPPWTAPQSSDCRTGEHPGARSGPRRQAEVAADAPRHRPGAAEHSLAAVVLAGFHAVDRGPERHRDQLATVLCEPVDRVAVSAHDPEQPFPEPVGQLLLRGGTFGTAGGVQFQIGAAATEILTVDVEAQLTALPADVAAFSDITDLANSTAQITALETVLNDIGTVRSAPPTANTLLVARCATH